MSANPIANGGLLRKPLEMPDFRSAGVEVKKPGTTLASSVSILGKFLREVTRRNMENFRVVGPDETESNQLQAIYEVGKKVWLGEYFPEDNDGGQLATNGRVMEMLSEHTVEGWLEGYILTGRHGLINSYEPFIHVIDSMFNQHAKWLEKCKELAWRAPISSLNLLITGLVWRQDHNGFTHQDPGFLDVVANKSPEVVRIYLPPDANSLCRLQTIACVALTTSTLSSRIRKSISSFWTWIWRSRIAQRASGFGAGRATIRESSPMW